MTFEVGVALAALVVLVVTHVWFAVVERRRAEAHHREIQRFWREAFQRRPPS